MRQWYSFTYKKSACFTVLLLFLLSGRISFAQPTSYTFSASEGLFTPITGTIPSMGGTLTGGYFNNIPIGFTFNYWNTGYTTVSASTKGWLTFGQSISNPLLQNDLTNGATRPLVAPLWDDLGLSAATDFSYETTGEAPSRIFTAQWLNMKWIRNASGATISFQVKLYESDGKAEFIYFQNTGVIRTPSASIGLAGPQTGVHNFVSLSSPYPDAIASSTTETISIADKPLSNQVFSFSPAGIEVSSPAQVPSGNTGVSSTDELLSAFQVTAVGANAFLNSLQFATSGTCTSTDILNLKLFYSPTPVFPGGSPKATIPSYSGSGSHTFSGLAQLISGTGYFWITCDVAPTATLGNTIMVEENPVLSFSAGTVTGTILQGGLRTISGSVVVISSSNPAVPAGNILQNTFDNIIYRFDISVSAADETITGLNITTSGTYSGDDVPYIIAYYSPDPSFNPLADAIISIIDIETGPGQHVFPYWLDQVIPQNTTGYIFITADVACQATSGRTIYVEAVTASDVTFLSGTKSGSAFAGGPKTIQDAVPQNVTNAAAAPSLASAVLSWRNPSDCYDEILIIGKEGSSITGSPSGDGSGYTADLSFGAGTPFDGGFVVYKGSSSPQTVTDLAGASTYYFRFFTRKGTSWSPGVEVSMSTYIPAAGEYRSAATGDWNSRPTWEIYNGSAWLTPTQAQGTPTNLSGRITVRNGHVVTVSANVTVDEVTVDPGGTVGINNPRSLTIANGADLTDFIVNGNLRNAGNIITTGVLAINNAAVYEHAQSGGTIPSATWNAGSTCLVSVTGNSPPSGLNQIFHNFTWNCPDQKQNVNLGGFPATVTGTFSLVSSGSRYINPGGDVTYADFSQTGGIYSITGGGVSRTVNVTNFNLQGGQFLMSDAAAAGILNVSGNFTHTAGTISESSTGSGEIFFTGTHNGSTGIQTYTSGGTVSNIINFTVNSGAFLQMAGELTVIQGLGTFTLAPGGTLGITSANGISAAGTASGNIQTAARIFNAGGNYIYNLAGAQLTGSGLPSVVSGTIKASSGTTLTSTNPVTINGSLVIDGTFIPGLPTQVFPGTGTLTGAGTVRVTRTTAVPDFLSQYPVSNRILSGLTVDYAAPAGGQIISAITYGNLSTSHTGGITTLGGEVSVSGLVSTAAGGTLSTGPAGFLGAEGMSNAGIFVVDPSGRSTIGNLVNNGTINLLSTSPGQNFSLMINSYSGNGVANADLFLTGGGGDEAWKWHYVAVPANMSKTVFTDIDEYNLMMYDDSYVIDGTGTNMDEGFLWHDGYVAGPPESFDGPGFSNLSVGKGYAFYHNSDVTVGFRNLTSLRTSLGSMSLQWNGANRTYPANYGYNLVGNSLTCGLNWNQVTESGDVDETVYYLVDYNIASYLRNVGGVNGGSEFIPPLQGFMVKANAAGASLNFSNAREHTTQARYKKGAVNEQNSKGDAAVPMVRLELNNSGKLDETMVWFSENATTGFEGDCDSYKLSFGSGSDEIYTLSGTVKLCINGQPLPETSVTIPVPVGIKNQSAYRIIATTLQGLDEYSVTLIDKYQSDFIVDLKKNPEYSFASNSGSYDDRFLLKISKLSTQIDDNIISKKPFNIYGFSDNLNIELLDQTWEGKKTTVNVYDLTGRKFFTENKVEWSAGELKQFKLNWNKGVYIVEIRAERERIVSKINLF